jgi:hypothetical protein
MKRLILLLIVAGLVYWVWARERSALMRPAPSGHRNGPRYVQDRQARKHLAEAGRKAGRDVQRALRDAEHEIRHAVDKTHDEVHRAIAEVRGAFRSEDDDDAELTGVAQANVLEREDAEGLPVPIVPGTRVTDAQPVPPAPPVPPGKTRARLQPKPQPRAVRIVAERTTETLDGQISATPQRAADQAREDLRKQIRAWLDPEVPSSWNIPDRLMDSIILNTDLEKTVPNEYGAMYITHLKLDKSPESRARFVKVYNHEVVGRRLVNLGGSLAFILICLAAVSGYIRADEATKGYYTNRLRMLAAAGVGAGGVLIYQMVT